jgi:hypothetical protein
MDSCERGQSASVGVHFFLAANQKHSGQIKNRFDRQQPKPKGSLTTTGFAGLLAVDFL